MDIVKLPETSKSIITPGNGTSSITSTTNTPDIINKSYETFLEFSAISLVYIIQEFFVYGYFTLTLNSKNICDQQPTLHAA